MVAIWHETDGATNSFRSWVSFVCLSVFLYHHHDHHKVIISFLFSISLLSFWSTVQFCSKVFFWFVIIGEWVTMSVSTEDLPWFLHSHSHLVFGVTWEILTFIQEAISHLLQICSTLTISRSITKRMNEWIVTFLKWVTFLSCLTLLPLRNKYLNIFTPQICYF